MQKKKVLIFIDWYLPGYKAGGPIQSVANLVQHFKDEFDFSIITRDTDYCETTPYTSVKSDQWNQINGVNIFYISQKNLSHKTIKGIIRKTEFDTVYLNGIYSLYFTLLPLVFLRKKHNKRVVIAARGMLAESALGVKKTKKAFFLRAVKVLNLFDKVIFHATNEIEKKDIRKSLGEKYEVRTAANLPQKTTVLEFPKREKGKNVLRLVNIARIAPEKNLLYALQVLKSVTQNVEFDFYGPVYNQEYWNQCKSAMDALPQNVRVIYKGSVESDKVLDVLSAYHFLFMPTQGENFGHIILQSLMTGCPVIISDQTPWKNLKEKKIGWDLPLDNRGDFAEKIDELVRMTQDDYNKLSRSAFDYANTYVNNTEIIEQNRHLFV
ncbi:MAG: glycosyltransferase family 4 protein [Bacteroidia bacterium]|nr:glycosyltransferase family 4 protein [Bacteroidia bacterium]